MVTATALASSSSSCNGHNSSCCSSSSYNLSYLSGICGDHGVGEPSDAVGLVALHIFRLPAVAGQVSR